jgi:lipopolysaccharide export system protein LptC
VLDRRFILLVIGLALLAMTSQVLLWLTRPPELEPTFTGPPRSGYTLDSFSLNALDETGKLSFTVSGPRLTRRSEDGSIFVSTPEYVMVDKDGRPWVGDSDYAWVSKDGSIMRLEGEVVMEQVSAGNEAGARLRTSDLTALPKAKTFATDAPAQIVQPGSILRGTGLRGDLNTKVLELLSDVHTTFEPHPRKR